MKGEVKGFGNKRWDRFPSKTTIIKNVGIIFGCFGQRVIEWPLYWSYEASDEKILVLF